MPLSMKTGNDSFHFEHELKTEMHEDYEYVKSLEKEVDELESKKANFSNIYDLLLEECVSKDVTFSYLHSLSDLNVYAKLQCLYLHKVKECESLAQNSNSRTSNVNAVCAECGKCMFNSNHDACVSRFLNDMNDRTKKPKIVQLILIIIDSGCTKHITGNLKLLCNFVEKFLGTVRFGNDQFAPILGYGDLNQGNTMSCEV
ncbi:hypothetical protein Tco_0015304 [Tanacetum coccineum]